ncbi:MAG: Ig-like domain-containing protein [Atribacterota bacterium]|nr:Ig-like domain-containing protein [Atribacterota bacterium]MDD4896465.1 Ig-like domain-containing protein [Atribacterota bacterium]MDD5637773.1 Ig-like domain-containing protein [Atribacterota bacterium]
MFKKKMFLLFCLPFILGLFLLNGCSIISPVAVTGVTLDQATMTLTAGGATRTLVATVIPADATNQNVNWTSSNEVVATVAGGVVTPLTEGTTTIIVATVDGGLTATCVVTVLVPLAVGDSYGGGIVAYILVEGDPGYDPNIQHGLIAATVDQMAECAWSNITDILIGTTDTAIGTGLANTASIIGQSGHTNSAAKVCDDYSVTVGDITYTDWFLPSKDELDKLYINRVAIGGFVDYFDYWSSSESDANDAWRQGFYNGLQGISSKNFPIGVRAIRAF